MVDIDSIMEDAQERQNLIEAASQCESGILLYYDDKGVPKNVRFGMTYANAAYLLLVGIQKFFNDIDEEVEDE